MPIGPQLPPGFPQPTQNSNDDDNEGPSLPPPPAPSQPDPTPSIGPALPPGFIKQAPLVGPALPESSSHAAPAVPRKRRVMGPAAPPPSASYRRGYEDDDEDVGPQPIPQEYSEYMNRLEMEKTRQEIESRASGVSASISEAEAEAPKRGAWMTVPPEAKKLNAILGTEMKARQFSRSAKEDKIDQSGWTKLPGEKQQDESESAGKGTKRKAAPMEYDVPPPSQHDIESQRAVEEYNRANRPQSLMEMHTKEFAQSAQFVENDASLRRFDRDRDLSSRRTDGKARQNLIDGATKLDDRFSRGGRR
ncbi:hypothetical protein HDU98_001501 [Podochytrium sp. JEL0797]|nr:hypothetical protein HDU98_001501 [Podochytrium sp. JEL0797]